jgi:mRNA interferase RelE/StbE
LSYRVEYSEKALKMLRKMATTDAERIVRYMHAIEALDDPFARGHGLVENKKGLWRYRVEDWRILCEIKEDVLIIHVVDIGKRREVYR